MPFLAESPEDRTRRRESTWNGSFNFYGGYSEFDQYIDATGSFAKLLLIDGTGQPTAYQSSLPKVNFFGWNFGTDQGAAGPVSRSVITVDAAVPAKVLFSGCALNTQWQKLDVFTSKANLQSVSNGPFMEVMFRDGESIPHSAVSFSGPTAVATIAR